MLGEPIYHKLLNAEDVGTRIQHMMDLQELWSTAYTILTRPNMFHTPLEEERAKALRIALDLLQNHMESEYNETQYAKEINEASTHRDPPDDWVTHRDTL
jgi:hypothetical protein